MITKEVQKVSRSEFGADFTRSDWSQIRFSFLASIATTVEG